MSSRPDTAARKKAAARLAYVLDDDQQIGMLVAQMLVPNGYAARQFTCPIAFTTQLKVSAPDLIVLDLALGQSDAVEVMRQLEALEYKGKVLLISGRDESTLMETQDVGKHRGLLMLQPLKKPFRAHHLKDRLAAEPETEEVPPTARTAPVIKVDLGEALRNHWLELWYQPKIDLKSLSICGAEALLRARHPEHGIVPPSGLLPPSGDALHQPLARFVMRSAMADWRVFADQGRKLRLAVNVPVSVIQAADFITFVRAVIPDDPNFPGLIVELTEDEIIRDPHLVREIATQLRLYNTWISIDDFGTAYASLSRLRDLPFIELKLDSGFVSNCSTDDAKRVLCKATVDLAHRFGASVCAEGVENIEDLRALIGMGCSTAQGFLFAQPMERGVFAKMLVAKTERLPGIELAPEAPAGVAARISATT